VPPTLGFDLKSNIQVCKTLRLVGGFFREAKKTSKFSFSTISRSTKSVPRRAEWLMLYRIVVQVNRIQNARPAVFDEPRSYDERTRRLAIMGNVDYAATVLEIHEFQEAARTLRLEVIPLEIRRTEDIAPALESLKGRAHALYVVGDPLANLNRVRVNTFALVARLPTMSGCASMSKRAA
jgi:hypothetical protein